MRWGILVAPGFGDRGIEGKIKASTVMQEKINIPFFGICLGMQMATVVEFSRNVLRLCKDASSTEMNPQTVPHPVIDT